MAGDDYRELGEAALSWVMAQVRDDDGPWLPEAVPEDGPRPAPAKDRDSLYAGIAGLAPVLAEVADLMTPAGWHTTVEIEPGSDAPVSDLVLGTAGVVLAAIWAGGEHADAIATTGGEALLGRADRTPAGLDWGMLPRAPSRSPNYSHGTAGIATAPATGTSHLFAALSSAGVTEVADLEVTELRQRCLESILTSGVPRRLRPGFWDNDGRCCGTAGVGDVLLDAAQDCADPERAATLLQAARTMGDALVEGIVAFLLRLARVFHDARSAPVVDRPDQWWAVPAHLRTRTNRPGRKGDGPWPG